MGVENPANHTKGFFYPTAGWSGHGFWLWGNISHLPGIYCLDFCALENNGDIILDPRFNPYLSDTRTRLLRQLRQAEPEDKIRQANFLQEFGLVLPAEIEILCRNSNSYPAEVCRDGKYLTWNQLVVKSSIWRQQGLVVGLSHGSFDPPHPFHSRNWRILHDHCDVVLVGFDSDKTLRQRKGADRPRFPLLWRMWETAGIPVVDYVFEIPITGEATNEEYFNIYQKFGINFMVSTPNHPLREEYRRRMALLGGTLLSVDDDPVSFSSTDLSKWLSATKDGLWPYAFEDTVQYFQDKPFIWDDSRRKEIEAKARQAQKVWKK